MMRRRVTKPTLNLAVPKRDALFKQVSKMILSQIEKDVWRAGDMLPNEIELAKMMGVSQGTVRRSLKDLTDQGLLVRQQGRGTFVASHESAPDWSMKRFVRLVPDGHGAPLPARTEQTLFESIVPNIHIAEALKLKLGERVWHVRRTHFTDEGVVSFDELFLNEEEFNQLTERNMAHHNESQLYSFYQNECDVTILRCEETAKAVLLDEAYCKAAALTSPVPAIRCIRISYTFKDKPVEYRIHTCLTTRYHVRLA